MSTYKYYHMISKNMDHKALHEAGVMARPQAYEVLKFFSPHAFVGTAGRNCFDHLTDNGKGLKDELLLQKFYKRFPGLKLMPTINYWKFEFGRSVPRPSNPAAHFLKMYRDLVKQGYSEPKALELVEEKLTQVFERQKDEIRVLRGAALAMHGDSYLDRAQRVAELESQMKLQRFVRDIPKYERSDLEAWEENIKWEASRKTIESLTGDQGSNSISDQSKEGYQPVLY